MISTDAFLAFCVGAFAGAFVGFFTAVCCVASGRASEEERKQGMSDE